MNKGDLTQKKQGEKGKLFHVSGSAARAGTVVEVAEILGLVGFEPTASCTRGRRSTKLSHSPFLQRSCYAGNGPMSKYFGTWRCGIGRRHIFAFGKSETAAIWSGAP